MRDYTGIARRMARMGQDADLIDKVLTQYGKNLSKEELIEELARGSYWGASKFLLQTKSKERLYKMWHEQ